MITRRSGLLGAALVPVLAAGAAAQAPEPLMPIPFEHSAEFGWLKKPVLASRVLDDASDPAVWTLDGTGRLTFPEPPPNGRRALRVDLQMFTDEPAPTRNRLSAVTLRRDVANEDWGAYNRISLWIRPQISGFPMLPLQIVLRNDGERKLPDAYHREGIHYVTLLDGGWQRVMWEIEHLPRDRVTEIAIGYWVNKMLADPADRVAFEIGGIALERVEPDHYEGWDVAPGRIAFSHTGYAASSAKTALASGLAASAFELVRVDGNVQPEIALAAPVRTVETRLGRFQLLDFSDAREPGTYVLRAGDVATRAFRISDDVWHPTIRKAINFFYGERCGYAVPGSHPVDHTDWLATHAGDTIVMNGGWHDAGDLSQGMINTGEAVYAMFALAERLQARGEDPALVERILEEAKWGLDWVLRVRFPGGYRIGFAGNNLWTNGIIGDADDRVREARNSPNVNYIAAAAAAIAARVLRETDPELAARSLAVAEDDWRHAIAGVEGPDTWSTPAYAASPLELAGIGALASLELYRATGEREYAEKAVELGRGIVESQQQTYVGPDFPLAGFFFNGPDRRIRFHQFHRGNDQAPIVALAGLIEAFPEHADWMRWYAALALYSEYQKRAASTTEPYGVLPAYVYHETDWIWPAEEAARHQADREGFAEQVRQGLAMGDGYYLRAFPVWFSRRGNYGVLLSQAKALSESARVRRDPAAAELAQRQAQWVVGRNPFVQSTMVGEGYDWTQQYSVSSGDFVGALPVGMQTRGVRDVPYWPGQNMYVYKEVWVHPAARWLWLMADLEDPRLAEPLSPAARPEFEVRAEEGDDGVVTLRLEASGTGARTFGVRAHNLEVDGAPKRLTLRDGRGSLTWTARVRDACAPWVAVVVPDGDVTRRREALAPARAALPPEC